MTAFGNPPPGNPLLGENVLKLGAFNFNGDGNARTLVPERYRFNWGNSLEVARLSDELGFEAIVPYARFRSVVGPTHRSAFVFENLTWASAVAASTRYSCVMSTIHVAYMHPIVAAKALTTIDHVSNGRSALNIVCGWFKEEAEMFGVDFLDHAERYAFADEWITAMKRLWTDEAEFDFAGKYIRLKNAESQPKPLQRPYPPLMNAGGSVEGQKFVGDHCDIAFVSAADIGDIRKKVESYRSVAQRHGERQIQVWVYCAVVQADTSREAMEIADRYADHADKDYVDLHFDYDNPGLSPSLAAEKKRRFAMGGNGLLLVGGASSLADNLRAISDAGVDGVLLTWVDFVSGLQRFGTEVLPLLERQGLRKPFVRRP